MKDLKHLIFFEDLLQNADNALIRQAQSQGRVCVAYVYGDGHLLHDQLSLRVQPCSAGAGH